MNPVQLKSIGYLISTLSVLLLSAVAWSAAGDDKGLRLILVVGAAASIAGMFLRWLSYSVEARQARPAEPRRGGRPARLLSE